MAQKHAGLKQVSRLPKALCGWERRLIGYVERMHKGEHCWMPHQWLTTRREFKCARCAYVISTQLPIRMSGAPEFEIPACELCRETIRSCLGLGAIDAEREAMAELARWRSVGTLFVPLVESAGGNAKKAGQSPEALYGEIRKLVGELEVARSATALEGRLKEIVKNVPRTARKVRRQLSHHHRLHLDTVEAEEEVEELVVDILHELLGVGK